MTNEHHIELIEAEFEDNHISRISIKSCQKPEAEFTQGKKIIKARAYCNLHRLWENQ